MESTVIDLNKVCRTCKNESPEMQSLYYSDLESVKKKPGVNEMLMACTSLQVDTEDGLPKLICQSCLVQLRNAYSFKEQCEKTDSFFKDYLQNLERVNVKEETEIADVEISWELIGEINSTMSDESCNKNVTDDIEDDPEINSLEHQEEDMDFIQVVDDITTYQCRTCSKDFYTLEGIRCHNRRHTGKTFKCKQCNKSYTNLNYLRRHELSHPKRKMHVCKVCNKTFTSLGNLKRHLVTHLKRKPFSCTSCNRRFNRTEHLQNHITCCNGKNVYVCDICNKTFFREDSLEIHKRVHENKAVILPTLKKLNNKKERETLEIIELEVKASKNNDRKKIDEVAQIGKEIYAKEDPPEMVLEQMKIKDELLLEDANNGDVLSEQALKTDSRNNYENDVHNCDQCDKPFSTPEYLAKHIQEDHIAKPYTCTICDKTYSRGEYLIRHLKTHLNPTEIDIKCSICEKAFTRSDQLAEHIKLHLQEDKRHICNVCGRAFNRPDNLKTHQRIHTGQKDNVKLHLCAYCGKEFNNSSNMIVHMRRHTGERPYKCNECSKGFPRFQDLKCHQRTHSGEKPYMCTICGKAFTKSNKLVRHTRVHTGERPYVCNLCGRAFTQSNDLTLHMRRHTGARPYACGICPARFIQSVQLRTHRKSTGHTMETQPDLNSGYRVEPVLQLSDPVPIRFKTHNKPKAEEEFKELESKESQLDCNAINIMV